MEFVTSIDINTLLAEENYKKCVDLDADSFSFGNTEKLVIEESIVDMVVSNYTPALKGLCYNVYVDKQWICLYENKDGKSRHTRFDISKHFLKVNKRRGFAKDFVRFSSQLRQIGMQVKRAVPSLFWTKDKSSSSQDEQPIPAFLSSWIASLNTKAYTCLKPSRVILSMLSKQLSVLSTLFMVITTKDKTDIKLNTKRKFLNSVFMKLLGSYTKLAISNIKFQKLSLGSVYTLCISSEKMIYVEKNSTVKTKIVFDFKAKSLVINGQHMTLINIDWFTKKIESIGRDIKMKRSDVFCED